MNSHRTLLAALLALVSGIFLLDQPIAAGSDTTPAESPRVLLEGLAPDMQATVLHTIDLFDRAGLELPPLHYRDHGNDQGPCMGRVGIHRRVDGVSVIDICREASIFTDYLVVHETAHAWADHNLSDEHKAQFQQLRGWEHWRNYEEAAWHDNGTEQAAEILVWGVLEDPMPMLRIEDNSCDDLLIGFTTLTRQAPVRSELC